MANQQNDATNPSSTGGNNAASDSSNNNNSNNSGRRNQPRRNAGENNFNEAESSLKGEILDYVESKNSEQFVSTKKAIELYVGRTFKDSKFARQFNIAVRNLDLPEPTEPETPDADNAIQLKKWEFEWKTYQEQLMEYDTFQTHMFSIVMGQCTKSMTDRG